MSYDFIPGSSGGGFVIPETSSTEGVPLARDLRLRGVVSLGPQTDNWGAPTGTEDPDQVSKGHFTMTSPDDGEFMKRDLFPNDPSKPEPFIAFDALPTCASGFDGQDNCELWEGGNEADLAEGANGLPSYNPTGPVGGTDDASPEPVEGGEGAFRTQCKPVAGERRPAVAVGIHGGTNVKGGIGTFMTVCAPYSRHPYTQNWPFVTVKGVQMPRKVDDLGGQWGWRQFDRYTSHVYREIDGEKVKIRPPSIMMCPPNYLLRGIGLSHGNGGENYYHGVTGIYCLRASEGTGGTNAKDIPEEIYLRTKATEKHDGYTFMGEPFSLSQPIGGTDCPSCVGRVCKNEGEVINAIKTEHDDAGRLTWLALDCVAKP